MADQVPAHPLLGPHRGKRPLILSVAWTEASVALVFMLMRTYTNAFIVESFKRDRYWAMVTLVGSLPSPNPSSEC